MNNYQLSVKSYPVYKDSAIEWLGDVPEHWEVRRLKDIGDSIIGLTYSPEDILDCETGGILVLRSSNIQNGQLSLSDTVYVNKKVNPRQIVRKGDILICSRNGSRALIGKNICIDERIEGQTFGAFMTIYRSRYFKFISKFFNSKIFESQSGLFGSSTINQLTINTLNNFLITLPPLDEQKSIATYLDTKTAQCDRKIDLLTQKATQYGKLKQSLINETVTCGLDKSVQMKDSGVEWIGEVPEHWEHRRIKDLTDSSTVVKVPNYLNDDDLIEFIPMTNVDEKLGRIKEFNLVPLKEVSSGYTKFKNGDVIFAKITPCMENGNAALVSELRHNIGFGSTEFMVFRPLRKLTAKYLHYFLHSDLFRKNAEPFMKGTAGQKRITSLYMTTHYLACPPLSEQKAIADYLDKKTAQIDQIIQTINTQIEKLKELRKTLINDVVTGKIKV